MMALAVQDESQIGEARRRIAELAHTHGFGDVEAGRVALVATELATNLTKHAGHGEILAAAREQDGAVAIELIALDRGPGMANVQASLVDGYSSAGTGGRGLGAVKRQAERLDIASWPGTGTAILARIGRDRHGKAAAGAAPVPEIGAVSVPKAGETVCGDSWAVARNGGCTTLMVADGLGHGPQAAEAAVEAVRLFHRFIGHDVAALLEYIHGGLRATRGAAVSIARFDPAAARQVAFGGIGNVVGALASGGELRRLVSMPGTAGYNVRKIQSFSYPFPGGLAILASDGIATGWTLERYRPLESLNPTLLAAMLYRDFGRGRDDATVLVARWPVLVDTRA